ncbi:hypothetical protein Tco_0201582 [Tanacetum coccineum]
MEWWLGLKEGANRNQHSRDQRARSGGLWSGGLDPKRGANRDQHSREQRGHYNMLEDVKRIADSAKRRRLQICGRYYADLPIPLRKLLHAARCRSIRLFFLPTGMSKRETNRTFVNHRVRESSSICSVIQNHLKPGPLNHPLRPYCLEPVESLKFFISKHPQQPKSPFRELDIHAPLSEQLAKLVIIEYPVIHVFLPSHNVDFKVVKDIITRPKQPKTNPVNDSQPEPKGVYFKEEEIKDDDSSDPLVLDLMNKSNSKIDTQEQQSIDNELGVDDLMNFDFDTELVDVYSNLISETNPDDFLDFDGLCDDLPMKEENIDCEAVQEELEEGEIADSD